MHVRHRGQFLSAILIAAFVALPALSSEGGAVIVVCSEADSGAGSLREALIAAAHLPGHVHVIIESTRIKLESPLPPLISPGGITIDASASRCEIDASAVQTGSVLDIVASDALIKGLSIEHAKGAGIVVRSANARLKDLRIRNSGDAIYVGPDATGVLIDAVDLSSNTTGVNVTSGTARVVVQYSRFSGHTRAAIWGVAPAVTAGGDGHTLVIRGNGFQGDRIGIVVVNVRTHATTNRFNAAREAAVHAGGAGSLIEKNTIGNGSAHGIVLEQTESVNVIGNQIEHNAAAGVMVNGGRNPLVSDNRMDSNNYGIITVNSDEKQPPRLVQNTVIDSRLDAFYILGGAPRLLRNRAMRSGKAAVRILDIVTAEGKKQLAAPILLSNVFENNQVDGPVYEKYATP